MRTRKKRKGSITIEAAITYPLFLMVLVTFLYIMRIVYTYGLIQHAVSQTAKELSMYTYIYQVSGLGDLNNQVRQATGDRTAQFNSDVDEVVKLYDKFMAGDVNGVASWSYGGTTNPKDILKNIGSALVGEATGEANRQLLKLVAKPLMEGYIGADSKGNSADERLKALRVVGGMDGLNLDGSSLFADGKTIDLVVCYAIDPIFPIDIMPSLTLANRAYVRGLSGETIFQPSSGGDSGDEEKEKSVWDMRNTLERGKAIQEQDGTRTLPDHFPTYSAFDSSSGTATATVSIDLRAKSYQSASGIKGAIEKKCRDIVNYQTFTSEDVTVNAEDIKHRRLVVYIPSSTEERQIDTSEFNRALEDVKRRYPEIEIVAKEID